MKRKWLQIAMLVLSIVAVNLQCLARCADEKCASHGAAEKKQPPCHRGKAPSNDVQERCVTAPVADVRGVQSFELQVALPVDLPVLSLSAIIANRISAPTHQTLPLNTAPRSTVLRI